MLRNLWKMTAVKQHQFTYAMPKISEIWAKISRAIHGSCADEPLYIFRKREFCHGLFCGIKELQLSLCKKLAASCSFDLEYNRKQGGAWAAEIIFCCALSRTKRKLSVRKVKNIHIFSELINLCPNFTNILKTSLINQWFVFLLTRN